MKDENDFDLEKGPITPKFVDEENLNEIEEEVLENEEPEFLENENDLIAPQEQTPNLAVNNQQRGRNEYKNTVGNKNFYKNQSKGLAKKQEEAKEARNAARKEKQESTKLKAGEKTAKTDGSNLTQKDKTDKTKDSANLKEKGLALKNANQNALSNKVNSAKSKAFAAAHPVEAGKMQAKSAAIKFIMTKPAVIVGAIAIVGIIFIIIAFLIVLTGDIITSSGVNSYYSASTSFWWPIGSLEITSTSEGDFATDEPISSTVTSPYGWREWSSTFHYGIDIDVTTSDTVIPIIASKSGTVTIASNSCTSLAEYGSYSSSSTGCETGYGNYVEIDHGNGITTRYAHLDLDSVTVEVGDTVTQGQVIGYMGKTGNSAGVHLHFEIRVNGVTVDPLNDSTYYVSLDDTRANSAYNLALNINLYQTSLSKSQFITKMDEYCDSGVSSSRKEAFCTNFAANSETIYTTSVENGINPEIVVAFAEVESEYSNSGYNYWGIAHYNTATSGSDYDSLEEGIKAFSELIYNYNDSTSSAYSKIETYQVNAAASSCGSSSYFKTDTLVWVQGQYSYIGDFMVNIGSDWGVGGCVYLEYYAKIGFLNYTEEVVEEKCGTSNKCTYMDGSYYSCENNASDACDIADYILYTAYQRALIVEKIFYD